MSFLRKIAPGSLLLCILLLLTTIQANAAGNVQSYTGKRLFSSNAALQHSELAPTVHVLGSLGKTTIVQFPLVPSGIKTAFPKATGLVTIVRGDRDNSTLDTVTLDVQNMPPNDKFTVFFTELSAKPFGNAEYVGDVITRGDGSGESVFHLITFVAFAADNRNAGTSQDQSGTASGIQLEHVGLWFDGLPDARVVLQNPNLTGTPFDGGHGALHAGPQALTDGQTLPVI